MQRTQGVGEIDIQKKSATADLSRFRVESALIPDQDDRVDVAGKESDVGKALGGGVLGGRHHRCRLARARHRLAFSLL